jgi:signal transduction histidine kinase
MRAAAAAGWTALDSGADDSAALRMQFRWAVRIRWLAIAGFLLLGMVAWTAGVVVDPLPCVGAAAAASTLNFANAAAVRRWRLVGAATVAAVAGDVLLITFLVARTGGEQSPFLAMYAIQVLAAAMLVEVRVALACAAAASAALAAGILTGGRGGAVAVESAAFLPVWIAFFAFGLGLVAWVGGHVSQRLRGREHALLTSNRELRVALRSVEEGNRELRATCERLEQAERQLAQSEKMRALGDFVAGVAHELNNPIAIVAANLQLLEAEAAAGPRTDDALGGEALRDCGEAVRRAARIVADLRQFARADGDRHWQVVDLNERVRRTVRLARHLFGRGVDIDLDLGELPPARVIGAEIDQLLLNLLSNAARAVGERGRVSVSTRLLESGDGAGGQRCILLAVADDGPGIPPAARERIFEPFFTTRPAGEGVGLGLSLAFAIAERHGGAIRAAAGVAPGARLEVLLPVRGECCPDSDSTGDRPSAISSRLPETSQNQS